MTDWVKTHRHQKLSRTLKTLKAKLQGTWNYYGLIGNHRRMQLFYRTTCRTLHKWLNRRSQRQSVTWPAFNRMLVHFQVPRPRIVEKYKMGMPCQKELSICQRLQDFRRPGTILMAHPRASWLEEPCAGIPPAGICEGGAGQPASLPRGYPKR